MPGINSNAQQGILWMVFVLVAVGLGAWFISYLRRQFIEQPEASEDLGTQFREAYEDGEIDADEYQRVRAALARQGKGQLVGGFPRPAGRSPREDRPGPGTSERPSGSEPSPLAPPDPPSESAPAPEAVEGQRGDVGQGSRGHDPNHPEGS